MESCFGSGWNHLHFLDGPLGSGHLLPLNSGYDSRAGAYGDFFVTLRREANGFGFKLVGGSEEGTQVGALLGISAFYGTEFADCFTGAGVPGLRFAQDVEKSDSSPKQIG